MEEISELERRIEVRRKALLALDGSTYQGPRRARAGHRFAGMRPAHSILIYLTEQNEPKSLEEIAQAMIREGAILGKTRPVVNVAKSLQTNIRLGKLMTFGELFGLAEWNDRRDLIHLKKNIPIQ